MKKKLLTILLSVFVMVTTFTTNVFAATTVSTWAELTTAIGASSTSEEITLGGDITVTDTYTIESGKDITIDLNGHTINGNSYQIFILKGKLKIQDSASGGTITGGANSDGSGGAVAIKGAGELTLESGSFTGNSAKLGGAISIDEGGGKFIMNGGKISGNTSSSNGAGIYADGSSPSIVKIEMNGGEISCNTSSKYGGGIYLNNAEMQLNGGKIINNIAGAGAGIAVSNNPNTKLYLGGNSIVKDNVNSSSDIDNIFLIGNSSILYISTTKPLTSEAELYVTVNISTAGEWGAGKDVGKYFNSPSPMTDDNYQYFYFTNRGSVEKNSVYSVTKSGSDYVTAASKCKIGSIGYPTLEYALSVVTSDQTITMLDDISYTDGTDFIIDGKTVTIDFDSHSLTVNTDMATDADVFKVTNSGNLTVKNGDMILSGSNIKPFNVTGSGSNLTLINVNPSSNLSNFLTLDGGTATINGGTFGTSGSSGDIRINLSNNATVNLTNNPIFNSFQGDLFTLGQGTTDPDTLVGTVNIDSGTFNSSVTTQLINLIGKANVTINGGTYTSTNADSSSILIGANGYKSNVTINNFTSDCPYVFRSSNNSNIESFAPTVKNGHYKYNKGQFAIDQSNSLKPNVSLKGGYYGPNTADDDALAKLTAMCASGYQVEVLDITDPEYANGYRYTIVRSITIASILPSNFPQTKESGWLKEENGKRVYLDNTNLTFDGTKISTDTEVTKDGTNYKCDKNFFTYYFVMESNILKSIELTSGFAPAVSGTYVPYKLSTAPTSVDVSGSNNLEFVTNGKYVNQTDTTVTVTVDNAPLTYGQDYEVSEGSTHVKLLNAYLNTLANGEHTIKISMNGYSDLTSSFTVTRTAPTPEPDPTPTPTPTPTYDIPKTGVDGNINNNSNHSLLKLSSLSILAIGTYIVIRNKKDN